MRNLKIKEFNVQDWLDNPAIFVCTRAGEDVCVMSYDPENGKPVTFGVEIDIDVYNYDMCYANGRCSDRAETDNDLFIYSYDADAEEYYESSQEDLKEAIYLEIHKNN